MEGAMGRMRKVQPITFEFKYIDASDSEARRKMAFKRIYEIAKQNIIKRRRVELAKKNKT